MSFRTLLRAGPGLVTVAMLALAGAYYPWRHYGSWPAYAIVWGALCLIVWHTALIVVARERIGLLVYAFANMALYVILAMVCLPLVTGDSP